MKHYLSFKVEDFAQDADFLKWVKYPQQDLTLDETWLQWLSENPSKKETVEEARLMILAVVREKQFIPDDKKQGEVWRRIQETIGETESEKEVIPLWQRWYSKAAVIVMLIGAGWFALNLKKEIPKLVDAGKHHSVLFEKQVNNADLPKTIVLSDGTSIVLQPHSQLEYPKAFAPDLREVFLTGEAFFEVKKDPARPFMVRADGIVTRVLGTSFTIRSYNEEGNVLVQVKTGKVSVFIEKTNNPQTVDEPVQGVVLMPNQQVVYERRERKMTKSLVENPDLLIPVAQQEFEFVDTPVKGVFSAIEKAYGIDVVYDEEAFSNCYLNASLDDVPLYDKLKLICKGIDASYEIMDSHIIIYGRGCNN